jgi:hypothetical protein
MNSTLLVARLEAPSARDAETLSEWVETVLTVEGLESLTRVAIRQRFQQGQQPDDAEIGLLFAEVARRHALIPDLYPFEVDPDQVAVAKRNDLDSTLYRFLLLISLATGPLRWGKRFKEINSLLDFVAREALCVYLGPGSRAVRFSEPPSDGRPTKFVEAVSWVADLLDLPELEGQRNPDKNDAGVDVIAWRPFRDLRPGFTVILAQVTCELMFQDKCGRVPINLWKSWIHFGATPATALVVPFAIPLADSRWEDLRNADQIILERLRLCELLGQRDLTTFPEWAQIRSFNEREIELIAQPDAGQPVAKVARVKKEVGVAHKAAKKAWAPAGSLKSEDLDR